MAVMTIAQPAVVNTNTRAANGHDQPANGSHAADDKNCGARGEQSSKRTMMTWLDRHKRAAPILCGVLAASFLRGRRHDRSVSNCIVDARSILDGEQDCSRDDDAGADVAWSAQTAKVRAASMWCSW